MPAQRKQADHTRRSTPYDLRPATSMATAIHSPVTWGPAPHQTGYRHSHSLSWADHPLHYQSPALMPSYTQPMHTVPTTSMTAGPMTTLAHHGAVQAPHPNQSTPWTREEDEMLMESKSSGLGWNEIHQRHFPTKSGNACRKRHERLMVKLRNTDWDDYRIRRLIRAYNESGVREELWRALAERLDERWEDVERVCFQQGLRGLRTARQRHARTRSRASSGLANSEVDRESPPDDADDSGIGLGLASVQQGSHSIHSPGHPPHTAHSFEQILHSHNTHSEYGYA